MVIFYTTVCARYFELRVLYRCSHLCSLLGIVGKDEDPCIYLAGYSETETKQIQDRGNHARPTNLRHSFWITRLWAPLTVS
jgi:hypothetical protein